MEAPASLMPHVQLKDDQEIKERAPRFGEIFGVQRRETKQNVFQRNLSNCLIQIVSGHNFFKTSFRVLLVAICAF